MKIIINILLLLIVHQFGYSQIIDTLPPALRDTNNIPTVKLGVMSDTTHITDTIHRKTASGKDTVIVKTKIYSPRKATIRSALVPGWGQIYNKKYWKVPIVYAAIGIPTYFFFDNKKWYNKTQYALSIVANDRYGDPDSLANVDPQLLPLVIGKYEGSLVNYRNDFRRNMDLSILIALVMWGVNVVDATVDAHLRGFDVSDELSMKIKPVILPGTLTPGVSFVVNFK